MSVPAVAPARRLTAPDAQLVAWLLIAAVNALIIAFTLDTAPLPTALTHHALDAGHMVAAGLLARAVLGTWNHVAHGHRAQGSVALMCMAFMLGTLFLRSDLAPRAAKLAGSGTAAGWLLAMLLASAASVVVAAWAGVVTRKGLFRFVAVLAALQLTVANHLVFVRSYPGVHLHVVLLTATFVGSTLVGMALPSWPRISPALRKLALLCASLLAAASLVLHPSSSVLVRMFARPGTAFAPFVSQLHTHLRAERETARYPRAEHRPDVPPSRPAWVSGEPVVVLVTLDALRADIVNEHLADDRLGELARLRDTGTLFEDVRTPAPATMVALTSIFSGRYFSQLYWSDYEPGWPVGPHADDSPRLPSLLRDAGVATATFHGNEWMHPDIGIIGHFAEHQHIAPSPKMARYTFTSASRLNAAAIDRLETHEVGRLFIYMHWLEAHAPYDLGSTSGSDYERYLAELEIVDAELRRLSTALEREGLRDRATLLVSSDHGEAFGEHDSQFHGVTVYEEMVRVPLIAWRPLNEQPRIIREPASLMDLAPTILDLMGGVTPGSMMGQSLVPLLTGAETTLDRRPIALDTGRHQQGIVFRDGFKIIRDRRLGTVELYDLRIDPKEATNLVDALPVEANQKLDVLDRFFAGHELRRPGYEAPFRPP